MKLLNHTLKISFGLKVHEFNDMYTIKKERNKIVFSVVFIGKRKDSKKK